MEMCSYFIYNKALFGPYPSQENVNALENIGVSLFVNLTFNTEKNITKYTTKNDYINFPIHDRSIPRDIEKFCNFIKFLYNKLQKLKKNEKIYVHCKGGHGRSGIVVALLITMYYKLHINDALILTKICHLQRPSLKTKWKQIGCPQTLQQKSFINYILTEKIKFINHISYMGCLKI